MSSAILAAPTGIGNAPNEVQHRRQAHRELWRDRSSRHRAGRVVNAFVESKPNVAPPEPGTTGPLPPPRLVVAVKSMQLITPGTGVVKVSLKPFNEDAAGVVTLREGSKLIARGSYTAKTGKTVTVSLKPAAETLRSLARRRSLSVTLTATAQAGTQAARARLRR
jgi:hypothetical protein